MFGNEDSFRKLELVQIYCLANQNWNWFKFIV